MLVLVGWCWAAGATGRYCCYASARRAPGTRIFCGGGSIGKIAPTRFSFLGVTVSSFFGRARCRGVVPARGASSRCWGALRGVHGEVKHPAHLRRTRPQPTLMVEKVGQGEGARTGLRDACASHARTTACPPPTKRMGKMAFRIAFPISQLIIFWWLKLKGNGKHQHKNVSIRALRQGRRPHDCFVIASDNKRLVLPTKITRLQFANLPAHQLDSNWIF